ncbi:hypothetical protein CHARACLAT_026712 [Characodon lateralis]|uniref:Uncharacterized protein n=1 Tax=Characodon lateralis TaxID=208331 RepID=A0ABU7DAD5_9TELE|nr:hypothetical protein [Characodon lateralis]
MDGVCRESSGHLLTAEQLLPLITAFEIWYLVFACRAQTCQALGVLPGMGENLKLTKSSLIPQLYPRLLQSLHVQNSNSPKALSPSNSFLERTEGIKEGRTQGRKGKKGAWRRKDIMKDRLEVDKEG